MKFTLSWLKHFLQTDASAEEIADTCTMIGLELEELTSPAEALRAFTIGHVIQAKQHPNADRLRVCIVDPGPAINDGKYVQVVCGAPNARTGMKGVFAPVGTYIPGTGLDLKSGVIRGEESNGMLCSERELMLSDDHEGIIDLPKDAPVGESYASYAGLDDPVIDIGVTPNRPDALGIYGIARDLAAANKGTLKPLSINPVAGTFDSPISVSLDFDDPENTPCPLFVGRYIRGVKNGPSPDWMQKLLRAVGLRPISALVDVTNYITLTFGRPLHVFDADKVHGNIHARLAREGETLEALDGKTYTLNDQMTVIADDNGPEGIAGVIGGMPSGCTDETVNVFIEAAWFDPVRTAATGRKLNVITDARYRFERGVDPAFVEKGAEIATELIMRLCGGEPSHLVIAGEPPLRNMSYPLRLDRVRTLAGVDVKPEQQIRILNALGFSGKWDGEAETIDVGIPEWRPDIHGEADLVEEIVRIYGYDRIGHMRMPQVSPVTQRSITVPHRRRFRAARALASRGMNEAVTWSFLPETHAKLFGGGGEAVALDNPISTELSHMRPSLLPNLIAATGRNKARGMDNFALFEVGQIYRGDGEDEEDVHVSGVRCGSDGEKHWNAPARTVDIFDAKADLLAALETIGAPVGSLQTVAEGPPWYHPGRVGSLQLGPKNRIATFGDVHPRILAAMDVEGPVVAFEINLDAVPVPKSAKTTKPALNASDLQPVRRDFAFVVEDGVAAGDLLRAARSADKALIDDVSVFDVFSGGSIGDGQKSIAIEVTLQPRHQTLTDEEIDAVSKKVIDAASKATGARLRS